VVYRYDDRFLDYVANTSDYSAKRVVGALQILGPIGSVLDVGCARGTWLHAWSQAGARDICGVDGDYVDTAALLIDRRQFISADIATGFDLGRRFDLVQSLEVAEHLPIAASATFVASLTRHSRGLVLFSAAPPGQGGEHHINEQPYDYWRDLFRGCGYSAIDCVRPRLAGDRAVSFWYRYNLMLYVSDQRMRDLPKEIRQCAVPDNKLIEDIAPLLFKIRKFAVRPLPRSAIRGLARIKAHFNS
jgi:SAM-dependent methyltransferase